MEPQIGTTVLQNSEQKEMRDLKNPPCFLLK